jgi:predicted O-methyltransferase YrrM
MKVKQLIGHILNRIFDMQLKFIHPKESTAFAKEYFKNKPINVAEIGVFMGRNSKSILNELNVRRIYLIDPYKKYSEYKNDGVYNELLKEKKIAHKNLKKYNNRIIWIESFSEFAVDNIKEKLDFIYIDGNHEYKYAKRDINLYWEKIVEGGVLAGHDIADKNVSRALIEFVNKKGIKMVYFGDKLDWWIIKK